MFSYVFPFLFISLLTTLSLVPIIVLGVQLVSNKYFLGEGMYESLL